MLWLLWRVGMLGAVAVVLWPAVQHMQLTWQIKRQAQHWLMQLESTQQQAMLRSQYLTVCPTMDKQHCSHDWRHAVWMRVFTDDQDLGCFKRGQYLYATHWRFDRILFEPLGGTKGVQGQWWWGTSAYCCWRVILSHTGRLRMVYKHANLRS